MLNPHTTLQRLTPGRPTATMTPATPRPAFSEAERAARDRGNRAPTEREILGAGGIDVHALARRVYDLMQQDLRIERHRRGQWPW
jgi:hypothetical protein